MSAVAVPAAFLLAMLGNQEARQRTGTKEKYHFIQKPIAPAELVIRRQLAVGAGDPVLATTPLGIMLARELIGVSGALLKAELRRGG